MSNVYKSQPENLFLLFLWFIIIGLLDIHTFQSFARFFRTTHPILSHGKIFMQIRNKSNRKKILFWIFGIFSPFFPP